MADPNRFPWRVEDVRSSDWVYIENADGATIGAVFTMPYAENLEWAQKIVDLVNEAYARPSDGGAPVQDTNDA